MSGSIGNINRLIPGLIEPGGSSLGKPTVEKASNTDFADELFKMVNSVNDLQAQAGVAQQAFVNGEPVELHDLMIKAEEAGLAMDLLLEVRNRLLNGFKELIRMPV